MKRMWQIVIAGIVTAVVFLTLVLASIVGWENAQAQACAPTSTVFQPASTTPGPSTTYDEPEQKKMAQIIIGVGLARKFSLRDIQIALMVAMQESGLRNLAYGHLDSLGLFQQRPSVDAWGTAEQIMDPVHATNKFYDALKKVKNRENRSLIDVAMTVQSPDPEAYAKTFYLHEQPALELLSGVKPTITLETAGISLLEAGCSDLLGDVEVAVQAALSYNGKPYNWRPSSSSSPFDSSHLTMAAFQQAGVKLPASAIEQYKAGVMVGKPGSGSSTEWLNTLQRGDLVFWARTSNVSVNGITHVAMYLGNGEIIDATGWGEDISVRDIYWSDASTVFFGATRPIEIGLKSAGSEGWRWPLANPVLTSSYGMRFHPIDRVWRLHDGSDFGARSGTPVYAAQSGRAVFVGSTSGGGNTIILDHGSGIKTYYLHLSAFSIQEGARVSAGQRIGSVGNTGKSKGAHLHYKVTVNGSSTDPIPFMRRFGLVL